MGFKQLITKVEQAEAALEEKERHASAQWRQLKSEWIAAWTPGRIVIATTHDERMLSIADRVVHLDQANAPTPVLTAA